MKRNPDKTTDLFLQSARLINAKKGKCLAIIESGGKWNALTMKMVIAG